MSAALRPSRTLNPSMFVPKAHNLADGGNAVPQLPFRRNDLNGDATLADTIEGGIVRNVHRIQLRGTKGVRHKRGAARKIRPGRPRSRQARRQPSSRLHRIVEH